MNESKNEMSAYGKKKREYNSRNAMDTSRLDEVGDRVYIIAPKEKSMRSYTMLTREGRGVLNDRDKRKFDGHQ